MGINHFRHVAVIVCVALACVISGCVRNPGTRQMGPPPRVQQPPPPAAPAKPAVDPAQLEKELAKKFTTTTDDGTIWKAYVTQVHEYNDQYIAVVIYGIPQSEWFTYMARYDQGKEDWEESATRHVSNDLGEYDEPDPARTAKKWAIPKEKLDAWIKQAEEAMKKMK
ncbi:MAG: hypothetical protein ACYDCO_27560 [Armatimonadota bacterium]